MKDKVVGSINYRSDKRIFLITYRMNIFLDRFLDITISNLLLFYQSFMNA